MRCNKCIFLFLLLICALSTSSFAQQKDKPAQISSTNEPQHFVKFNINNISTFIRNYGQADISNTGDSGFEYPIGSGKTVFYSSGFLWIGRLNNKLYSGGFAYETSLKPGKILSDSLAENPNLASVRAYRVRPDYKTSNLSNEILDEGKDYNTIYNQYEKDWNEWPAKDGAPFKDVNKNGIYEPGIDIPGFQNADQTIWYVANDLDSNQTKKLFGSLPMGIELQVTVWGYKDFEHLKNVLFKRFLVINKSKTNFEEMYFGIWSDPDLGGDAGDDLVGCDTLLNAGYVYNGDDSDPSYGSYIPAAGFGLLQGPIIPGNVNDIAAFKGKKIVGKKNIPMTAFGWYGKGTSINHDPPLGNYNGTLQLYNLIRGLHNDGTPIPDPIKAGTTKYPFSGDPVTRMGFIGGVSYPNGFTDVKMDHRMMLCSGPFTMAPGDTQEVIIAQLAAGGLSGQSRFAGISHFKKNLGFIRNFYEHNFAYPVIVNKELPVQAAEFDREVVLMWGSDQEKVKEIENVPGSIYSFQGYNVYQLSRDEPAKQKIKYITSFDLIDGKQQIADTEIDAQTGYPRQVTRFIGSDSGIQRFISINKDYFNNEPLNNGSDYNFGVSYYSITKDLSSPYNYYESPISVVNTTPQTAKPGIKYGGKVGDIITAEHIEGNSSASVYALIIDPINLTGDEYKVSFKKVNNDLVYDIFNITKQKNVLINQTNVLGDNSSFLSEGFIIKFSSFNSLTDKDVYKFRTTKTYFSEKLAMQDFEKINVFPNPYYGGYRSELNKYERHITFAHLPQRAIIRIFNLAGQLVRKLEKDSFDQFLRWNMLTEEFYQIPSGLYIAYIEMPDFGVTKIVKFSVLTEVFVPDNY